MKKSLGCFALAGALVFSASTLFAQEVPIAGQDQEQNQGQRLGQQNGGGHWGMTADMQLAHLTRELGLNTDQQSQIRPILQARDQQMQALFQSRTSEFREQMMNIRESSNAKIEAVLNDQQRARFEEMTEHHQRGNGAEGGWQSGVPVAQQPQ